MPHAEIKYSSDLDVPLAKMFETIERVINDHDPDAGACKGRGYPTAHFHHSHILIEVSLLAKPTRNAAFTAALMQDLETATKALITRPCAFSLLVSYSPPTYVTNYHAP